MKLRDYQDAAVDALFDYFEEHDEGNPIVAMPTGTGKSVVLGSFIRRALELYPGTRVLMLTHVKELISQNFEKLLALWPTAPAGIYSAGLQRRDTEVPIIFGGVATVARGTPDLFGHIDLLLIDECHLVSPKESTMYRAIIAGLRAINPKLRIVGFTATHYRLGQGMLTLEGGIFTDVCFDLTKRDAFNWLLHEGYLSRLVPKPTGVQLDISAVHVHGGEFKTDELQAAVDQDELTYSAVREMLTHGEGREHWLIFASGIEHATHVADMLDSMNVSAVCVHSKMHSAVRDAHIESFRKGRVRAMVNNGILTTGFDFPGIDLIGMLRPTQSPGLWVQMLGRGTRPVYADGFDLDTREGRLAAIAAGPKPNCLVLDFARNTQRLGPINDPVLPRPRGKGGPGVAPVRLCEVCGTYNHASVRVCVECGAEFPRELKLLHEAGTEALIAEDEKKLSVFKVDRVIYNEHRKAERPPTILVSYYCGLRVFKEWVCLEHEGYPGKKARGWWRQRAEGNPPASTAQALASLHLLRTPVSIKVWLKSKYDEIVDYDYDGSAFQEKT